jgi:hypothetical protein
LFQEWATNVALNELVQVQQIQIPIPLGTGAAGTWAIEEFLAVGPGGTALPPTGIDPGFGVPPRANGIRFTGSFEAHRDLEHLLLSKGGTVLLQVHGIVAGFSNPALTAPLVNVTPATPIGFSASFNGSNEVPATRSPCQGTGSFTLTGGLLAYNLTLDPAFKWTAAAIYGPAGPRANSSNLIAPLDTSLGVMAVTLGSGLAQQAAPSLITYSGTVPLTQDQGDQLKRGELYVNFLTVRHPKGELRGQILPDKSGQAQGTGLRRDAPPARERF